jgi:non-specific serine/threonine protein kinase
VRADFALTVQNAASVAQICQQLDGMPLALELAAARVRTLTPEQIVGRLGDAFQLLAGGNRTAASRQQNLRATLDWSYELLSSAEQALFLRLAVFAGGFDLEAAEAACAGDGVESGDVLDLLDRLVDKSLVHADESMSAARYRLLEPVRQYAAQHFGASDEHESTRRRHAEYYLALAQDADRRLRGPEQVDGFARLNLEAHNHRLALAWAERVGAEELGMALAAALAWFWVYDAHYAEGERWLGAFLARARGDSTARAWVLACLAVIALLPSEASTPGWCH